jgi:outer membrane murein-binding lipoprotein Lpp
MKSESNKITAALMAAVFLSGCATAGKDVVATYVSPTQFANFDCDQIRLEMGRLNGRVNQLTGRLDEAASNDKAILVAGGLLFWPALFALGGTKQQETELARLKGEYDALQSASTQKKCS